MHIQLLLQRILFALLLAQRTNAQILEKVVDTKLVLFVTGKCLLVGH
jgi:hypothetical protein